MAREATRSTAAATAMSRVRRAGDAAAAAVSAWSPVTVALAAGAVALAFVLLRLVVAADGDITRFVVAGRTFVDPGHGVHVFPSSGYDGQFYWRLALDPAEWARSAHGVTFDNAYRAPRVGYPLLAWLAAGGQPGLVPWTLVAVNVAAVAAVAGVAGRLAADAGHPPAYGLLVAAAPGLVMPLGRDLAECVTVACLLGGVLALRRGRPVVAAALWSYAVLTREQALLLVAAYALWRLAPPVRRLVLGDTDAGSRDAGSRAYTTGDAPSPPTTGGPASAACKPGGRPTIGSRAGTGIGIGGAHRGRPGNGIAGDAAGTVHAAGGARGAPDTRAGRWARIEPADLAWGAPVVVFAAWQAVLWRSTGDLPAASAGGSNLVAPFSALVPGLFDWATGSLPRLHVAAPLQLAVTVALVVAAARRARAVPTDLGYTVVAAALATVAATCLAASIWRDPSDMRHLVDVSTWSTLVLIVGRSVPPRWVVVLVAVTWAATAAVRVAAP